MFHPTHSSVTGPTLLLVRSDDVFLVRRGGGRCSGKDRVRCDQITRFFAGEAEEDVKAIDRSTLEVQDQQVENEPVRFNDERSELSTTNHYSRGVDLIHLFRVQNDVFLSRHLIIRRSQTIE